MKISTVVDTVEKQRTMGSLHLNENFYCCR